MSKQLYQHWKLDIDQNNILWLAIDRHESSVNSLNKEVLSELDTILDSIETHPSIDSVIIYSAKKTGFIAGADITQFTDVKTVDEAFNLIRQGQLVFNKLADLSKPTVAMIEGFCLGGGLELALACRYRVAEQSSKTKIGLPEVSLGLIPGWGGTVRLPRLIGAPKALKLIMAGKVVDGKQAEKLGIVDSGVPKRVLKNAAVFYAQQHPAPHQPTFLVGLANQDWMRPILARIYYNNLITRVNPIHYPAPYAVLSNWEQDGAKGEQALLNEAKAISELMMHPTSQNLVRVFFLRERLKSLAKKSQAEIKHVHVIGAGAMGGDIAAWCALQGFEVTLQDREATFIAPAIKRAYELFKNKLRAENEVTLAMDRLTPDVVGKGISKADVVIEAIYENLEAKQAVYKEIEPKLKPDCLLATNTSSLPLQQLAEVLQQPERLVGLHFFNPVAKMELVEIVSEANTDPDAIAKGFAFVKKINRLPLPVKSSPGFLVNRILMPYLLESVLLVDEGYMPEYIDKCAKEFGMPMGPIELADRVGLDICLSVAEILTKEFGGTIPATLYERVNRGELGVKTGKGFYQYKKGKIVKKPGKDITESPDTTDRLILRMLNEAVACLRQGVVEDSELLDAGMIFGTGFAPFRGGPINYALTEGVEEIRTRLVELAEKYGERFQPDEGWDSLEKKEQNAEVLLTSDVYTQKPADAAQL